MDVKMELTPQEIQMLLYCIDLIIQNFGENEDLELLYQKLYKMKEWSDVK